MEALTLDVEALPAGIVVNVVGTLAYGTTTQLRELLRGLSLSPGDKLVFNLAGLAFCDSTGVTTILAARNLALAARAELALAAVPPHTERILRMIGVDQILPLFPDPATAVGTPAHLQSELDE
jgi:anti-sigma B factor antagonist